MKLKYVKIGDVVPYENNPRKNEKAVQPVQRSIERFGFLVPIILDKNNVIIAGHTRLKAAENAGMKEVPVIYAEDLTGEQVDAFRLADNKTAEIATWDVEKLQQELDRIENIDMTEFMFYANNKFDADEFFSSDPDTKQEDGDAKMVQCPFCGEWMNA